MPNFLTQCPFCQTSFKVTEEQMQAASGVVRCGSCMEVFLAGQHRIILKDKTSAPESPAPEFPVEDDDIDQVDDFPEAEADAPEEDDEDDLLFTDWENFDEPTFGDGLTDLPDVNDENEAPEPAEKDESDTGIDNTADEEDATDYDFSDSDEEVDSNPHADTESGDAVEVHDEEDTGDIVDAIFPSLESANESPLQDTEPQPAPPAYGKMLNPSGYRLQNFSVSHDLASLAGTEAGNEPGEIPPPESEDDLTPEIEAPAATEKSWVFEDDIDSVLKTGFDEVAVPDDISESDDIQALEEAAALAEAEPEPESESESEPESEPESQPEPEYQPESELQSAPEPRPDIPEDPDEAPLPESFNMDLIPTLAPDVVARESIPATRTAAMEVWTKNPEESPLPDIDLDEWLDEETPVNDKTAYRDNLSGLKDEDSLEPLTMESLEAIDDDPIELVKRHDPLGPFKTAGLLAASLVLMAGLGGQYLWYHLDTLVREERFVPLTNVMCRFTTCPIAGAIDLNALVTEELLVRSHPRVDDALQVDFIFRNDAAREQLFPLVELNFTNNRGSILANRVFSPEEYLPPEMRLFTHMPAHSSIQVSLALVDPGPEATGYSLTFRNP